MKTSAILRALAPAMALLLLAGCAATPATRAPAQPAGGGRISLYSSLNAEQYGPLVKAFTAQTGIQVDVVFAGTGEILKRIQAEAANPLGDVAIGGGAESYLAFAPYFQPYKVKDDQLIGAHLKGRDGLWYGFNALPMVIMYNKQLVPAGGQPQGWQNLADPRWKGKLAMADPTKSGTAFAQLVTMLQLFGRDDGKGWALVRAVVNNAKVLGSSSQPPKGANDGEYALALTHENIANKYAQGGGPVGIVYPREGTAVMADASAVIKGAKNLAGARKFQDFVYSQAGQEIIAKDLGLRPVRGDVALPAGLVPLPQIKVAPFDLQWAAEQRDRILGEWKNMVIATG